MQIHADKNQENKNRSVAHSISQKKNDSKPAFQFEDNRAEAVQMQKLQEIANNSIPLQMVKQAVMGDDGKLQAKPDSQNVQVTWTQTPIAQMRSSFAKHALASEKLNELRAFKQKGDLTLVDPQTLIAGVQSKLDADTNPVVPSQRVDVEVTVPFAQYVKTGTANTESAAAAPAAASDEKEQEKEKDPRGKNTPSTLEGGDLQTGNIKVTVEMKGTLGNVNAEIIHVSRA